MVLLTHQTPTSPPMFDQDPAPDKLALLDVNMFIKMQNLWMDNILRDIPLNLLMYLPSL